MSLFKRIFVLALILVLVGCGATPTEEATVAPTSTPVPDHDLIGKWEFKLGESPVSLDSFIVWFNSLEADPADSSGSVYYVDGCMSTGDVDSGAPIAMRLEEAGEGLYQLSMMSTALPTGGRQPFPIQFIGTIDTAGAGPEDDQAGGEDARSYSFYFDEDAAVSWSGSHLSYETANCQMGSLLYFHPDLYARNVYAPDGTLIQHSTIQGITNIVAAKMIVEWHDGTEIVAVPSINVFEPVSDLALDFVFDAGYLPDSGLPVSGKTYTFTLVDFLGNPVDEGTDVFTKCNVSPVYNLKAEAIEDQGIMLTWDHSAVTGPGFDPASGVGSYRIDFFNVEDIESEFPAQTYGADFIYHANHLIPWADFGEEARGEPDGNDFGLALSQLEDGDYLVSVDAMQVISSVSIRSWINWECSAVDYSTQLLFSKQGSEFTFGSGVFVGDEFVEALPPDVIVSTYCGPETAPGICTLSKWGEEVIEFEEDLVNFSPAAFSPDGSQIAFSANHPSGDESSPTSLFVAGVDGSNLTEIVSDRNNLEPAWSPDGEWLAFHSNGGLGIVHPDGTGFSPIWNAPNGECLSHVEWSPDGEWLVMSTAPFCGEGSEQEPWTIQVFSRADNSVTLLADDGASWGIECPMRIPPFMVAFSPDGTQVAYVNRSCEVMLVNVDGSGAAEQLDIFPYWWTSMASPQWAADEEEE